MDATDLAERLDRSIGPAPDHEPSLAELLVTGRHVVRRRRLAGAVASAAAVLVVAGGAALVTGGQVERVAPPMSGDVTADPSATSRADAQELDRQKALDYVRERSSTSNADPDDQDSTAAPPRLSALLAEFPDAELTGLDPAAVVTERYDDPVALPAPGRSVAAAVIDAEGAVHWVFLYDGGAGWSGGAVTEAASERGTFSFWISQQTISRPGQDEWPGENTDYLVRFTEDDRERLAPLAGVVILEQRPGVDVGPSFASAEDDTVAAVVRDAAGDLLYVLARRGVELEPQFIAVAQADGGADLDAFLDYAREKYAGGEGLL